MITYTLIIFVINFGSMQMPGFASLDACNAADRSIERELQRQLAGSGAANMILATCVKVTK